MSVVLGTRRTSGGIMGAMERTAAKVVDNVLLAAASRLAVLGGMPLAIGMLGWFASSVINLQQQAAVQAAEQARLVGEVRELQDYRREAFARGQRVITETANLTAAVGDVKRQLERIDARIDKAVNGR